MIGRPATSRWTNRGSAYAPPITRHRWPPHRASPVTSSVPLTPASGNTQSAKSVAVCPTTRRAQPTLMSTNGPHSRVSDRGSTPFSVGTTLDATPTIIRLMNPTVMACRVAP